MALATFEREHTRELEKAEALCRRAIALAPEQSGPYYALSHVLAFQRRADEGVAAARKAFEREPTSAMLQANVASRLIYSRRFDDAIVEYQKAIQLQPTFHLPYEELGHLYLFLNREQEALEVLTKAWQLRGSTAASMQSRQQALSSGGGRAFFELLVEGLARSQKSGEPFDPAAMKALS